MREKAGSGKRSAPSGWRLGVPVGIAAAFVGGIEWYIGWGELLSPWRSLSPAALLVATLMMLASHGTRALRVHDYFGRPVHGHRGACLLLVLRHNLFNNLLPMRSGELAFPVLMRRSFGIGPAQSVPGLLWFRLLDLHVLVLLATPAWALVLPPTVLTVALSAWLVMPWFAWRGAGLFANRTQYAPGRLAALLRRLHDGLPQSRSAFGWSLVWTLGTWVLKLTAFVWFLRAFAPLTLPHAVLGAIGGELTSVLPIHGAGGFGTYEAGIVAATAASGVDTRTLLGAAVNLHLFVLGVSVVAGVSALLPWPMHGGTRDTH